MKISKLTGISVKARHHLSKKTLPNIYYTLIYLYPIYCNMVWTNTYPTRLKPFFYDTKKKKVRLMTFSSYRKGTGPIFTSFKLLTIYQLKLCFTNKLTSNSLFCLASFTSRVIGFLQNSLFFQEARGSGGVQNEKKKINKFPNFART